MQVIRCYNERCEFRNAKRGFCDFDVMREGVILSYWTRWRMQWLGPRAQEEGAGENSDGGRRDA